MSHQMATAICQTVTEPTPAIVKGPSASMSGCVSSRPANAVDGPSVSKPVPTPSVGNELFPEPGDLGYCSAQDKTAAGARVEEEVLVGHWPRREKFKCFQLPIPDSAQTRLVDLKVLLAKPLTDIVSANSPTKPDISLQLRYLGRSEESASLFLVVQCEKTAERAMKRFFKQKHIREQFEPEFHVHVLALPPKRLAAGEVIDVWTSWVSSSRNDEETLCGLPIFATQNGRHSFGTIGGLIMTQKDSELKLYGMTTAHLFQALEATEVQQTGHCGDNNHQDFDLDDNSADDESFELEFSVLGDENSNNSARKQLPETATHVGYYQDCTLGTSYDWSLVELDSNMHHPNTRPKKYRQTFEIQDVVTLSQNIRQDIVILSCGREEKTGVLINQQSLISIGPGGDMIQIYDLIIGGEKSKDYYPITARIHYTSLY